jgi:hypothetical protein
MAATAGETGDRTDRPVAYRAGEARQPIDDEARIPRPERAGVEVPCLLPVAKVAGGVAGHPMAESLEHQTLRQAVEERDRAPAGRRAGDGPGAQHRSRSSARGRGLRRRESARMRIHPLAACSARRTPPWRGKEVTPSNAIVSPAGARRQDDCAGGPASGARRATTQPLPAGAGMDPPSERVQGPDEGYKRDCDSREI